VIAHVAWPGLAVAAVVAIAATFLSVHYGASAMLFALLLGMALNFLAEEGRCLPGIQMASTTVLRAGVALLGLRITIAQVQALGWHTILLVVGTVALTIAAGTLVARALGLGAALGTLTGGAVAICGASAALAIASILPKHKNAERDASFTVIGVTTLSTIAMIVYPIVVASLGLDHRAAGVFLGGTIHDVAQVAGAGQTMGPQVLADAIITKLLRVAFLLPAIAGIAWWVAKGGESAGDARPAPPVFLFGFLALAALNSLGVVPPDVKGAVAQVSAFLIITAIAALGMKTSLLALARIGIAPVMLLVTQTVFIGLLVVGLIYGLRVFGI